MGLNQNYQFNIGNGKISINSKIPN